MGISKQNMVAYLKSHFRYHTMNSWNASTSYAQNVKINGIDGIDKETENNLYELIQTRSFYLPLEEIMCEFDRKWDYKWQMGWNGRSGGYIVLYQGFKKKSEYKTKCDMCGINTHYEEEQPCHVAGCEGYLIELSDDNIEVGIYPGKSTDQGEDFEDWTLNDVHERYLLVKDFDRTVDRIIRTGIKMAKEYRAVEREIFVPKRIMVMEKIAATG